MRSFKITNPNSGMDLGTFQGADEQEALEAFARDAGYGSYAEACEVAPPPAGGLLVEEVEAEVAAEALRERVEWSVGDRVEGGDTPEDHDTGRVIEVRADGTVIVAWDSGVSTPADAASLRPEA